MSVSLRNVTVFDLDGTLTRRDTYTALLLRVLGRRPWRWLGCVRLPFAVAAHYAGVRDNAWLKTTFLSVILSDIRHDDLRAITEPFVAGVIGQGLRTGARATIERHRAAGDYLVLATASFDFYAIDLGKALGMDAVVCTESAWEDDRLVPVLRSGNCYGTVKRDRLQELLAQLSFTARLAFYSDSHADIPSLELAQEPVAVNPTRRLAAIAAARNYRVEDWDQD